jgi:hypothetical protein
MNRELWDDEPTACWDDETEAAALVESRREAAKKPSKQPARPKKPRAAKASGGTNTGAPVVQAANTIDHEALRGNVMMGDVRGKKRAWACDGEYVFFRRRAYLKPDGSYQLDSQGARHRAIDRHEGFIQRGDIKYIETQDDIEICKVNEMSPLYRKGVYLGTMTEGGVKMAVVCAAMIRDWGLYADCLEEYAIRIKGKFHGDVASAAWNDALNYVHHLIQMRRGPGPEECARGLQQIRIARGQASGKQIILPPRRAIARV